MSTPSWWMPDSCAKALRPDDRLVGLHRVAGQARDHAARCGRSPRVTAPVCRPRRACAGVQQHDDLLQRGVAGPLADAVDRALDLAGPGLQAGERVGHGQPEVVVAVHRQHDVVQSGDELVEAAQERRVLVRHRVADGVGDVDRRRALVDRDLADLGGELEVGARRVHRRELDVLAVLAGVRDGRARLPLDVLARGLQLVLDVDVRGGDEGVDPRARRRPSRRSRRRRCRPRGCGRARRSPDRRRSGRSPERPRSRPAR